MEKVQTGFDNKQKIRNFLAVFPSREAESLSLDRGEDASMEDNLSYGLNGRDRCAFGNV